MRFGRGAIRALEQILDDVPHSFSFLRLTPRAPRAPEPVRGGELGEEVKAARLQRLLTPDDLLHVRIG